MLPLGVGSIAPAGLRLASCAGAEKSFLGLLPYGLNQHIEHGDQKKPDDGTDEQSAEHGHANGAAAAGPCPGGDHEGDDAEDGCHCGHEYGAKTLGCPRRCGFRCRHPFIAPFLGELDDEDRVLRGESDQ